MKFLAGLTNLEVFWIAENQLSDLQGIGQAPNLKELNASRNKIVSIVQVLQVWEYGVISQKWIQVPNNSHMGIGVQALGPVPIGPFISRALLGPGLVGPILGDSFEEGIDFNIFSQNMLFQQKQKCQILEGYFSGGRGCRNACLFDIDNYP